MLMVGKVLQAVLSKPYAPPQVQVYISYFEFLS